MKCEECEKQGADCVVGLLERHAAGRFTSAACYRCEDHNLRCTLKTVRGYEMLLGPDGLLVTRHKKEPEVNANRPRRVPAPTIINNGVMMMAARDLNARQVNAVAQAQNEVAAAQFNL